MLLGAGGETANELHTNGGHGVLLGACCPAPSSEAGRVLTPDRRGPSHLAAACAALRGPSRRARYARVLGSHARYWISAAVLPRRRAESSAERRRFRPSTVALMTLCGLRVPWHFVSTLRIPADSRTARTVPPAMTPVPSPAGLSSTQPAPKCPSTSCGMVVPKSGTRKRFFFACSPPLRMASGTSLALPRPTPTWPAPSPTTTRAEKLKRRPPLTTLATRLMCTTRSVSSRSFGLIGIAK